MSALRCTVLFVWCWFASEAFAQDVDCISQHCMVVVDAGSTGSRAHLFSYSLDATSTPTAIQLLWSQRVTPGLATLEANQAAIDNYLNSLFTDIPAPDVPVYFYATGGMRLLSDTTQQTYYQLIADWFRAKARPLLAAKTISGQEEGVFAWLAVAYETGQLQQGSWPNLGVIDTGGASVQIVFPLDSSQVANQHAVQLTLYGRPLTLFSYSALGLGNRVVMAQFATDAACFPNHYPLANQQWAEGDAMRCSADVSQWMHAEFNLAPVQQAIVKHQAALNWTVLGGLAYLPTSPVLQLESELMTMSTLFDHAQTQVCTAEWSTLSAMFSDQTVAFHCLQAAYYHALWGSGFGLSDSEWFDPTLGQSGVNWALGVVLLHPH